MIVLTILITLAASQQNKTVEYSCQGKAFGYYCLDEQKYNWCYGMDKPITAECVAGLECKCGFTIYNPCMWPFQTPGESCDGKPGDFFGHDTSSSSSSHEPPQPEPSESESSRPEPTPSESSHPDSSHPESSSHPASSEPQPPQPTPPESSSSASSSEPTPTPTPPESSSSSTGASSGDPEWPDYEDGVYHMDPNGHLPLTLKFDPKTWRRQIKTVIAHPYYNDHTRYTPTTATYQCSLHPPAKYDNNPTQLWIGRPTSTVTISYTPDVLIRLPDKYFGMFLGYAMDMYGLNPAMLVGLGAKESFSFARYGATDDGSLFIVKDEDEEYDCYSATQRGLCRDQNLDGPFQVETGGMATDVAILPNRFWVGDQATPKADRRIKYMYDSEVLTSDGFRAYHDYYTLHNGRATVLTSLDFHFRHNMVMGLEKVGLASALDRRKTREDRDSLEFATAMYTYNRGVFDTQLITMLANCDATMDPCTDCKLDGYGGHTTDIRTVCVAVDKVPESQVYNFEISKRNVEYFLETLESTYPFDNVNWKQVRADVDEAYDLLASFRSGSISFRYDWRTLLAVIRMHLPKLEYFVGDQVRSFQEYWGKTLNADPGPYADTAAFPYNFCSTAGGRENLCAGNSPTFI